MKYLHQFETAMHHPDDAGLIDRSTRSLQNSNYLLRFCESVLVAWSGEIAAGTELTSYGGAEACPRPHARDGIL